MEEIYLRVKVIQDEEIFNEGFVVLKKNQEEFISVEGVLTLDYITTYKDSKNQYRIDYYAYNIDTGIYELDFQILLGKNNKGKYKFEIMSSYSYTFKFQVEAILDDDEEKNCQEVLAETKKIFLKSV